MPTRIIKPLDGMLDIAGITYELAMFTGMGAVDVTGKALKLQDERVQFKATPNGADHEVTYTVALQVTREPLDETESARIAVKKAEQDARKDDKATKEAATRERDLKRAEASGRDGVLAVMGEVGNIAKAAHVLAALAGK